MAWNPDYCTVDELSAYVRIDDVEDHAEMGYAITAASRAVDHQTNRQFGQVASAEERSYTGRYDYDRCCWVVDIDDLDDDTGLTVTVDGTTVTAYRLEPVNGPSVGRVWTRVAFTDDSEATPTGEAYEVAVTALWGWSEVPVPVKAAVLMQASRFFARRGAPFGVAGSPEMGNELRLLAKLDPDVSVALRGYHRLRAVG